MRVASIGKIELPDRPEDTPNAVTVAKCINSEPTTLLDGQILIYEMIIDGKTTPDVALIEARTSTPVQKFVGVGQITEIFLNTNNHSPVGVVLESPEGEIKTYIWDPLRDGGERGFTFTTGWVVQIIVPEGATLQFLDYWPLKGYSEPDGDTLYGITAIEDATPTPEFVNARNIVEEELGRIQRTRAGLRS